MSPPIAFDGSEEDKAAFLAKHLAFLKAKALVAAIPPGGYNCRCKLSTPFSAISDRAVADLLAIGYRHKLVF